MIKTPLSTVIGGAFWTPGATVINGAKLSFETVMKKLFANGEQGFWYDPNDMGTMYRDAAGTIPVTGAGQPVGLIKDKSGRGNHASQTVSASRPILQRNATTGAYYLEFDGADDRLVANSFASMGSATTIFAGTRCNKAATSAVVARGVGGYVYQTSGQVTVQSTNNAITLLQSGNTVITAKYAASGTGVTLKVNNLSSTNPATIDRGFATTNPLAIGAFDSNGQVSFLGHIYSLIGVSRLTTDEESIVIEREIAKRAGAALNV
jgi:hypothetical protein